MTFIHSRPLKLFFFGALISGGALLIAGLPPEDVEKPPKTAEKTDSAEKKTHTVKPGPFSVKRELSGIVESRRTTPISIDLKQWSDLKVVSAVPHGTVVEEGDVLIQLDTEDLEKTIRDLKLALPSQELDLRTAELELAKLEETTPILVEKARRTKAEAEQDLTYFEEVSRPMRERDVEEDLKSSGNHLAYAEEELKQLKMMYEADDLTEQTEEIVLQRAQNTVDNYRWMLAQTKSRGENILKTAIPREHRKLQTALELKKIDWRTDDKTLPEALGKKRLDVAKQERELEEARRSLAEHESDLAAMTVKAPHSGVAYYGMSQRGKWTTASTLDRKLIPGGSLSVREIVMTVADPAEVMLRLAVAEDKLKDLAEGKTGSASLKWNPDAKLKATVESVGYVPFSDNTFDAVLALEDADEAVPLMPGMTADAEIEVYSAKNALTVPKNAIQKEGDIETVTLAGGAVREIRTGRTSKDQVEVLEGLAEGDVVELQDEKKAKSAPDKKAKPAPDKKGA